MWRKEPWTSVLEKRLPHVWCPLYLSLATKTKIEAFPGEILLYIVPYFNSRLISSNTNLSSCTYNNVFGWICHFRMFLPLTQWYAHVNCLKLVRFPLWKFVWHRNQVRLNFAVNENHPAASETNQRILIIHLKQQNRYLSVIIVCGYFSFIRSFTWLNFSWESNSYHKTSLSMIFDCWHLSWIPLFPLHFVVYTIAWQRKFATNEYF